MRSVETRLWDERLAGEQNPLLSRIASARTGGGRASNNSNRS